MLFYQRYTWYKDGRPLTLYDDGDVVQRNNSGTLDIVNPVNQDEGFYQCFATNRYGRAVSTMSYLRKASKCNAQKHYCAIHINKQSYNLDITRNSYTYQIRKTTDRICALRSSNQHLSQVPDERSEIGHHDFTFGGPTAWNTVSPPLSVSFFSFSYAPLDAYLSSLGFRPNFMYDLSELVVLPLPTWPASGHQGGRGWRRP